MLHFVEIDVVPVREACAESLKRAVLYMAALLGVKHNPRLRVFYERLCAAGKVFKVAITACMRTLLTILNAMVRHQRPWEPKIA